MWTAFGIFLGTAFNVAVWNAGSINWRLMLGNYGPPNIPPKRVHQASDLETRCAPYPGNSSPPAYLLLPRVSTLVHEEEQKKEKEKKKGRTNKQDHENKAKNTTKKKKQCAPGLLGSLLSHVRAADV